MTAAEIVEAVSSLGGEVVIEGSGLRVRRVPRRLLDVIRQRKPEVVAELRQRGRPAPADAPAPDPASAKWGACVGCGGLTVNLNADRRCEGCARPKKPLMSHAEAARLVAEERVAAAEAARLVAEERVAAGVGIAPTPTDVLREAAALCGWDAGPRRPPCAFHCGKPGEPCRRCGASWIEHYPPAGPDRDSQS